MLFYCVRHESLEGWHNQNDQVFERELSKNVVENCVTAIQAEDNPIFLSHGRGVPPGLLMPYVGSSLICPSRAA